MADCMGEMEGYSRALYSNWFWHKATQLLVDAGEGVHLALRSGVWQPSVVAITHGHSDHVLGLAGFAGARRFGKGATSKPWTVLYPAGSSGVDAMRAAIAALWRDVEFPIDWRPLAPGDCHATSQHRTIEAFAVQHVAGEPSLGYRVLELRRRRRAEYAGLPQDEIERLARTKGRDEVMEGHQHPLLVHSGDAMPIDAERARGADLLIHDATFLGSDERRDPIQATTEEVFAVAREAGVAALVLNHLSVRYDRVTAVPRIKEQLAASGFAGDCWLLDEGTFVPLREEPRTRPAFAS
jgi:ribonuclease Z